MRTSRIVQPAEHQTLTAKSRAPSTSYKHALRGFKHFDVEGFIKVVEAQHWKDRPKVQLWIKGAEEGMGEDPFTLIKLRRRRVSRSERKAKRSTQSRLKARTKGNGS